ncbi:MAG: 4Fe-4S binding protein, partial [Gemmatimonadales bacterium]|nr:4Fe-4S binding protein [Gemmatimonadales bacterium]
AVTWESCMGCGVCEGQCETGAIALVLDERKGIPLDVREIGVEVAPPEFESDRQRSEARLLAQN